MLPVVTQLRWSPYPNNRSPQVDLQQKQLSNSLIAEIIT